MTASKTPPQSDPEQAKEGLAKRDKRGRPADLLPMKTILRRLPSVERQVVEAGTADHKVAAEMLGLLSVIALEKGFADDEIPLRVKVEWALKTPGLINQLREGWGRKAKNKYPSTVQGVKDEIAKRSARLKELQAKIDSAPVEAVQLALDAANDGEVVEAEEVADEGEET